jgi:hypothetical protein
MDGSHLGGDLVLHFARRAEGARGAHVDQEHDCELALFAVLLDERCAHARGDLPVDVPHVVAGVVFTHLLELHAAALEGAFVLTGEHVGDEPLRADLDRLDLLKQLRRQRSER